MHIAIVVLSLSTFLCDWLAFTFIITSQHHHDRTFQVQQFKIKMTVVGPRFALLGAFAAIATLSSVQETNGAAIHARQGYQPYRQFSRRFSHPSTRTVQRRQETPALDLPPFGPTGPPFPPVPPVVPVPPITSRSEGKVSRSSHQRANKVSRHT